MATIDFPDRAINEQVMSNIDVRLSELQKAYHALDLKVEIQNTNIGHIREQQQKIVESLEQLKTTHLETMGANRAKKLFMDHWATWLVVICTLGGFLFAVYEHFHK